MEGDKGGVGGIGIISITGNRMAVLFILIGLIFASWGAKTPHKYIHTPAHMRGHEARACTALPPQDSPDANYLAITACLASGTAVLAGGEYPLSQGLAVPDNATLAGSSTDATRIYFPALSPTNYMVQPGSGSVISFISFDANHNLPAGCCSAVFSVGDVHSVLVHDCQISNQDSPSATGIYFIGKNGKNNLFLRVTVSQMQYGVIFLAGLTRVSSNRVDSSIIHDIHCDSVTFAGYGEVTNSQIYQNGWDCKNGSPPIPGGGPYCLGNSEGALVAGNTVADNCGMLLDIDGCANFNVSHNTFTNPGNTWGGKYPYCQGSTAVNLLDAQNFIFDHNEVNNARDTNIVGASLWGDSNHIFSDVGKEPFSDLPNGPHTVVAFALTHRPSGRGVGQHLMSATGSTISNNKYQADCSLAGCAGVGYFAGRGTGWSASGSWTPNFYTANDPSGSNIGSHRCGGNWYAGNTACPLDAGAPCNVDDYQHPDTSNWRNDPGCAQYAK